MKIIKLFGIQFFAHLSGRVMTAMTISTKTRNRPCWYVMYRIRIIGCVLDTLKDLAT